METSTNLADEIARRENELATLRGAAAILGMAISPAPGDASSSNGHKRGGAAPAKAERASKAKAPDDSKPAENSCAPFRSDTAPRILALLAKGSRTFVEINQEFEKKLSTAGVRAQVNSLRGRNFIDRDGGDRYAIKRAGRAWLDKRGAQ